MAIRFKLDSTVYSGVGNADSVTLSVSLEDFHRIQTQDFGLDLQFTGDAYDYLLTQYTSSPCGSVFLLVEEKCQGAGSWAIVGAGRIYLSEITFKDKCAKCVVEAQVQDGAFSQAFKDNATEEIPIGVSGYTPLVPFQIASGARWGATKEKGFIKVETMLDRLIDNISNGSLSLNSTFFSTAFQQHQISISVPAVSNGDVLRVTFDTHIGGAYDITVTCDASATSADAAEYLFKTAIVRLTSDDPTTEEVVYGVNAGYDGSTTVFFFSYAEMLNFDFTLNGASQGSTVVQAYQYGMDTLCVSDKGLDSANQQRYKWQEMTEALQRMFDLQIQFTGSNVTIETHESLYNGASASVTGVEGDEFDLKADKTFLAQAYKLGSYRVTQGYENSQANWSQPLQSGIINAPSSYQALTNGSLFDMTQSKTTPMIVNSTTNHLTISQDDRFDFVVELDIHNPTGGAISTPLSVNGSPTQTISLAAGASGTYTYSFSGNYYFKGSQVAFTFSALTSSALEYRGEIQVANYQDCQDEPTQREDEFSLAENESQFSGCEKRLIDLSIPDHMYVGLGYELGQVAQGLENYSDSYFFVMRNSAGDRIQEFTRFFWFPSYSPSVCIRNGAIGNYPYMNLPLQRPFILANWLYGLPSDVDRTKVTFTNAYDFATNTFTQNTAITTETVSSQQDFIQEYETTSYVSTSDLATVVGDLVVGMNACGTSDTMRWLRMQHDLLTKETRLRLLSETIH